MTRAGRGMTVLLTAALLSGCATFPAGPSILTLPGQGKDFEQFRADDIICRQYAEYQVGGQSPTEVANQNAVQSAAVGTLIGGALGAAVGHGRGAAIGAASGLALGSVAGADAGGYAVSELQRRYDNAYMQCMYAKGNQVPIPGLQHREMGPHSYYPPPPPPPPSSSDRYYGTPPPPAPGMPPPPRP